jgi:hypothetical protein
MALKLDKHDQDLVAVVQEAMASAVSSAHMPIVVAKRIQCSLKDTRSKVYVRPVD